MQSKTINFPSLPILLLFFTEAPEERGKRASFKLRSNNLVVTVYLVHNEREYQGRRQLYSLKEVGEIGMCRVTLFR